eukprot:1357172-Pleurochrysis_carterae.AAC.1
MRSPLFGRRLGVAAGMSVRVVSSLASSSCSARSSGRLSRSSSSACSAAGRRCNWDGMSASSMT